VLPKRSMLSVILQWYSVITAFFISVCVSSWIIIRNVSNALVMNVSVSVFHEKLLIEFVISSSQTFFKWSLNNLNFCLSRSVLLLNWIVFTKHCDKSMIMLKKKLSVFCRSYLTRRKLLMILLLRLCLSYLTWCYSISDNSFLYFLLKMSKHSHTVLEVLSEFSDVFWDIIIFSFYEVVSFLTNHSFF